MEQQVHLLEAQEDNTAPAAAIVAGKRCSHPQDKSVKEEYEDRPGTVEAMALHFNAPINRITKRTNQRHCDHKNPPPTQRKGMLNDENSSPNLFIKKGSRLRTRPWL